VSRASERRAQEGTTLATQQASPEDKKTVPTEERVLPHKVKKVKPRKVEKGRTKRR
jgi:hypothetical protein